MSTQEKPDWLSDEDELTKEDIEARAEAMAAKIKAAEESHRERLTAERFAALEAQACLAGNAKQAGAALSAGSVLGGLAAPDIDPKWEEERKAREEQMLRLQCLQMATGNGEPDPVAAAKEYLAFLKGE